MVKVWIGGGEGDHISVPKGNFTLLQLCHAPAQGEKCAGLPTGETCFSREVFVLCLEIRCATVGFLF
jgi:hypothetical protein